jgi:hypothetical protein
MVNLGPSIASGCESILDGFDLRLGFVLRHDYRIRKSEHSEHETTSFAKLLRMDGIIVLVVIRRRKEFGPNCRLSRLEIISAVPHISTDDITCMRSCKLISVHSNEQENRSEGCGPGFWAGGAKNA